MPIRIRWIRVERTRESEPVDFESERGALLGYMPRNAPHQEGAER
jgi:hypothetical protein